MWDTIIDAEILAIRHRHAWALHSEHVRRDRERQRVADAAIVAEREARVEARRAHDRVRELVTP